MSILFRKSNASSAAEQRIMNRQFSEVLEMRNSAEAGHGALFTLMNRIAGNDPVFAETELYKNSVIAANAGQTPADAYREMDATTKIDVVPAGEHATLTRLFAVSRSIDVGKEVFEYRQSSRAGNAQTSMNGQQGVIVDHVDYKYDGTIVPIHDVAFGRKWREVLAMRADGFDALVDDAREAERTLMDKMNDYLFNGSTLSLKGKTWGGIKGDSRVVQSTTSVDLSSDAVSAEDIRAEFRTQRDVLYITNNCTKGLKVGVSREIMSNLERPYSVAEGMFGTIMDMVMKLRGIEEIYEDSALEGNEIIMYWADREGFHPVVGSAISTYAIERTQHNSNFDFVKWAAVGFVPKISEAGDKCALYATTA